MDFFLMDFLIFYMFYFLHGVEKILQ